MTRQTLPITRRGLLAGLGGAALFPFVPDSAAAQGPQSLSLRAAPATITLREGGATPVWQLGGFPPAAARAITRGDTVEVALENQLPAAVSAELRGLDGGMFAGGVGGMPIAPGGRQSTKLPLRQAGTFLAEISSIGDGPIVPTRPHPVVVLESGAPPTDRDEILLFEDWRLRPDNSTAAPGTGADNATSLLTINGEASRDITARPRERIRLRLINGSQRTAMAIFIKDHDVRVMAIDSQPAEPFLARNGQLLLAPGTRIDAFVDVAASPGVKSDILVHDGKSQRVIGRVLTAGDAARDKPLPDPQPLPGNSLPERIDLKNALRVSLTPGTSGTPPGDWTTTPALAAAQPAAFRARPGRPVVLALTNSNPRPMVFHLQGHHFRLLDRLDDGWKPFWLDTLMLDKGQTQRIALVAEHTGRWLMQAATLDWDAPMLSRWYVVE